MILSTLHTPDAYSNRTSALFLSCNDLPKSTERDLEVTYVETPLRCGFCQRKFEADESQTVAEKAYCFSSAVDGDDDQDIVADHWYLCAKCYDKGVRMCQFSDQFHFSNELIQLTDGVVIHEDQKEIINTYGSLPTSKQKQEYLKMCGLTTNIMITSANLMNA